jgi:hypothetical protein
METLRRDVIPTTMILVDGRGITWKQAPDYQDRDAGGPGWLSLESSIGETLEFQQVLHWFPIEEPGKNPYLRIESRR